MSDQSPTTSRALEQRVDRLEAMFAEIQALIEQHLDVCPDTEGVTL